MDNTAKVRLLAGRLAGLLPAAHYAAFGGAAALVTLTTESHAAPIQSPVANLAIPVTVAGVYLNIVTGATGAASTPGWDVNAWGTSSLRFWASNAAEASNGIVESGGNTPNLAPGTVVDGSSTFGRQSGEIVTAGAGHWNLNATNYIGFRFIDSSNNSVHYGWASVFVGATATDSARKFVEIWYESEANTAITVGDTGDPQVPEPTTAALLAAGAAGLLALRRRRQ